MPHLITAVAITLAGVLVWNPAGWLPPWREIAAITLVGLTLLQKCFKRVAGGSEPPATFSGLDS
jgi:hypothetical protein